MKIYERYGDIDIPDSVLVNLGYIKSDRMIRAKELDTILNRKDSYRTIKQLKAKYHLVYDEISIPASIIEKEYSLKVL